MAPIIDVPTSLTLWGQDKMDAILQTFSCAFAWLKMF